MSELSFISIKDLKLKLENKEITPDEVLNHFIGQFDKYDGAIKSALEIFDFDSIKNVASGKGSLFAIPGLIKDNIAQENRRVSCASKILENYKAPYDATVIDRLKSSGAFLLGRANMDEFAMGSSGETSAFQKTANPWDTNRVPGGSSSGSAACVSAGLVPWSLGSETGGSVRQPAILCGVVGMKPTYGLVSRYGLVAYASSIDQIGTITRTVYDNAMVLSAIAGHDPKDSTSAKIDPQDYTKTLTGKLKEGFTLGVIDNALEAEGLDPEVYTHLNESLKVFEKMGAKIKRIKLPMMDYGAAVYFVVSRAEAASNLAKFDGVRYGFRTKQTDSLDDMYKHTRYEGFGLEVKSRILIGNYVLSAGHSDEFYQSAKMAQSLIRAEFLKAFDDVDLLFAPGAPSEAFEFGKFDDNKLLMDLQDYFTCSVNLAGIPGIAVPCGFTKNKLPVGFQLIGPDFSEHEIYQAAYAYEQETMWHTFNPKV